ncbi:MAG TPA: O-antigen ligase family protein [Nitrospira sp.]|nr:O-antigen ligase family protein [Nitrospira sp.]
MRTRTEPASASLIAAPAPPGASLAARLITAGWRVQAAGLLAIALMTFFPAWSHVQEYLFFSLFAVGLAASHLEGRSLLFPSPLHLPLACLLGWILLSVPFATDQAYSFSEWRKLVAKVLLFYWTVIVWRAARENGTRLPHAFLAVVALGSLSLSLYAVPDFLERGGTWADRPVRAQAPSSDYNWLSTYMLMTFPLLVGGAWAANGGARMTYAGIAGLALLAQMLSYTRAGWLALLAQGVAAGLALKRGRLVIGVLVCALLIVLLLGWLGALGYHQDTLDPWTLKTRVAVWSLMLHEIADHPFMGVGYGTNTFMTRLGDHPETMHARGSHNFFLMVAMGSGIPALLLLLWVLGTSVTECFRKASPGDHEPFRAAFCFATGLMAVGFAVRNGFDAMFAGSLACLFWLLLGAAVAQSRGPVPGSCGTSG